MKQIDQCPSTRGAREIPTERPELGQVSGRTYWRSVEEYAGTPDFKNWLEREFPAGASELLKDSRRTFVKLMGASLALAGVAGMPGCRRPDHKLLSYSREVPEEIIPGKPLYMATAMPLPGGGAEGLLAETHTGRPTQMMGNPLHPINQGKASDASIASVLELYDPDRLMFPLYNRSLDAGSGGRREATWADYRAWHQRHFAQYDNNGGRGLAFLADAATSPARDMVRENLLRKYPNARWVAYYAADADNEARGLETALGTPSRASYRFGRAMRVVALDHDFLDRGPEHLRYAREFAAKRRATLDADDTVENNPGSGMQRLYAIESTPTSTGALADHRLRASPERIGLFALALARAVLRSTPAQGSRPLIDAIAGMTGNSTGEGDEWYETAVPADFNEDIVREIANDLTTAAPGTAVVTAGESLPPRVHALVAAINQALNAVGQTVVYQPVSGDGLTGSAQALAELDRAAAAGEISTLVCVGTNPVYNLPNLAGIRSLFSDTAGPATGGAATITLNVGRSETGLNSVWELNSTTYLESWGDVLSIDGAYAVTQPMIAPLYEPALSHIEYLGLVAGMGAGGEAPRGIDLVREAMSTRLNIDPTSEDFRRLWRRTLHDGVWVPGARGEQAANNTPVRFAQVAEAWRGYRPATLPTPDALEITFRKARLDDGRWANNPWLQELPHQVTQVTWDNPLLVSPRTARDLGVLPPGGVENMYTKEQIPQARVASITVPGPNGDMTLKSVAFWVCPGMADNTVVAMLGYGRTNAGRVAAGVGFNTYLIKPLGAMSATGARVERQRGGSYGIASTQTHWSMESRDSIARVVDKKFYDIHRVSPVKQVPDKIYGPQQAVAALPLAEQLGELAHTPENISLYENPYNQSADEPLPGAAYAKGPQWGMTIDLGSCTGCGVCTIACQSENNIPVVGKAEVAKGREMQWIRVDRYFTGEPDAPSGLIMQPVACVHCENAPCETVCPVNATVHGPHGTNNMAYNRCIGTRYCANNCPYKVRRFNWFDYAQSKFRGGLDPTYVPESVRREYEQTLGEDTDFNANFIPPRLREKIDEISAMQLNPNVTVRSRGVMEKCSYCIQRVNYARVEVKLRDLWTDHDQVAPIPDGFVSAACEQACPTNAIVFGDILDPNSRVSKERRSQRSYMLLGYLNTRPRTLHQMRIDNPNHALLRLTLTAAEFEARSHDPFDHGGGEKAGEKHDADDQGAKPQGDEHAFVDPVKRALEQGYQLSLRVMS